MIPEQIDNIKSQYTDKYVVVDAARPELARFRDLVGQVKTVNMSGRALVEFADYHLNIGWFDIDLDYLKVVDKPPPKEKTEKAKSAPTKPAAKPRPSAGAGEKKLSPLEMARMQGAVGKTPAANKPAPKPSAGGKPSTADILAAARGDAKKSTPKAEATAAESKPAPPEGKMSTADILAAARAGAAPAKEESPIEKPARSAPAASSAAAGSSKPAKVDRSKLSVEEMLSMARGEKSGGGAAPEASTSQPTEAPADEPADAAEPSPAAEATDDASAGDVVKVDKSSMSVDEMIAYCREKDAS